MDNKNNFWNNNYFGLALKNGLIAAIIVIVMIVGVLIFIHYKTNHGETRTIPELKGLQVSEAVSRLQENDLIAEIIDSLYLRNEPLGSIIEQNPAANTIVKPNRHVYLIINSQTVQQKSVPHVIDMSLRQAEAMLASSGFVISRVEYASSAYKDLVLEIKHNGKSINRGEKLADGSAITIVAGSGFGSSDSDFPYVVGMDLNSATTIINSYNHILGTVHYDIPPSGNEQQYIVYKQFPTVEIDSIREIDIWLSIDQSAHRDTDNALRPTERQNDTEKKKEQKKVEDIEEFF